MPVVLGISSLDCDSTVTFIQDNEIVYAAQEERFTRIKQQTGFPYYAIENGLDFLNIDINDISDIAYSWLLPKVERNLMFRLGMRGISEYFKYKRSLLASITSLLNAQRRGYFVNYKMLTTSEKELEEGITRIGFKKNVKRFHHQFTHITSSYYTSGFDQALVVSLDGYGSGATGSIFQGKGSKLSLIEYIPYPHSLGLFYTKVTHKLGFTPNRHEGKILGLAAYGDPDIFYSTLMKDFVLTETSFLHLNANDPFKYTKIFQEGKREDIAAAFQKVLEKVVTHVIQTNLRKYNLKNVCLAGGVAANVKMNQRIMELPECEEIYIHPGMSDCGTGTGAALIIANQQKRIHSRIPHVYLGPEFTEDEILRTLKKFQFQYSKEENIEKKVAKLLTSNKVVARFNERMEYGPRSLGNRSILCATGDVTINSWLNQRLNRTEFMPFAPVTLDYMAEKMYKSISKVKYTAEFMTVTVDCTEEMKRLSPAAVHIDGTARPQIARKTKNKSLYQILEYYYQMSGIPNLINTSFNIHEEPIVCTPYDALKTFGDGSIDYLAIGDYLVVAPHEIHP